jgi:hypothetical protein
MKSSSAPNFNANYQTHLKNLKLKGLQPKTIDAYAGHIDGVKSSHFPFQRVQPQAGKIHIRRGRGCIEAGQNSEQAL